VVKIKKRDQPIKLSEEDALDLIKDAITSAAERDIYTGDYAEIYIINKNGIKVETFELKHD